MPTSQARRARDNELDATTLGLLNDSAMLASIDISTKSLRSVNDTLALCTGRAADAWIGEPVTALIPMSEEAWTALVTEAREAPSANRTLTMPGADGRTHWLAARVAVQGRPGSEPDTLVMVARDITDEEQTRQELSSK